MSGILKDRRMHALLAANLLSSIGSGVTMIAVPWILVNRDGGERSFGYVSLGMTLLLFLLSPYIGVVTDRFSRKKIMLFAEAAGFAIAVIFSLWGFFASAYPTWQLIALFFSGSLYYTIHFPAKTAFIQEIFDRSQYKALNSLLEIQSQASSMIAGGVASLLMEWIDLSLLLLIDALTYLAGLLLILGIPYTSILGEKKKEDTVWASMYEGFRYLIDRPLQILFFTCSFMPFIGVMVGNYLFPVYIARTLHADAAVMGLTEMIFAIGAILAGFTIPFLIHRLGSYRTVLVTVSAFAVGSLLIAWIPSVELFLAMKLLFGWGNAGTRVTRNTIMMELVPNSVIGRVNSFFQATGMIMRVTLIGIFTQTIFLTGASFSLFVMGIIMVLAFIGILGSKRLFSGKDAMPLST